MGCSSSTDAAPPQQGQAPQQAPVQGQVPPRQGQVVVQAPNPSDPPFMQTAAPSGMSWGQYVRTKGTFIDPNSGFLQGPWAECISWGVIFEHTNDWGSMPQYAADGVVGGILNAYEQFLAGNPNKGNFMDAAQKLEDASHALADNGQPLPAIQQVVTMPAGAQPGQPCKVVNPQNPNTYMTVNCPHNSGPGQQMMVPMPVQPQQSGQMAASGGKGGMSTGSKVAMAVGGAVVVGGVAAGAYHLAGGDLGGLAEGAAGGIADGAGEVAGFAEGAAPVVGDALGDAGEWAGGAFADAGEWGGEAIDGFMDMF
eukprot:TRINITY_DN8668_c0_g1_i1.p1 TRINITY_DN8668_c0_g1~~TRINITY_DN8668_c0_g1_i1.p1  ORF type:complete len:310 (+),score=91.40 TRINITY_DN8668_c0_g1_i1:77-1006(+)